MITIHSSTTTDFSNNGLAVLDPLSCNLTPQVNGAWSLEMECSFDEDNKYLYLKKGNIIKVTDINIIRELSSTYQLFRIYDEVRTLTSVKVIAFPVALEATYDAIIENYTTGNTSKTVSQIMSTTDGVMKQLSDAGVTKYTVSVDYSDSPSKTGSWENTNLIAMISGADDESIINKWGGELAYDNYNIKIKKELGIDTDYEIRYGKNLTGLDVDIDTSGMITRIYPLSKEGYRYNGANNEHYINSDYYGDYPFVRCAFVNTNYALTDTSKDSHTDAAIKTRAFLTNRTADIKTAITPLWNWYKTDSGTHTSGWRYYEPEYVKSVLNDIIALLQEHEDIVDPDYVVGIKNLIKTCIKEGINWIKNVDIKKFKWVKASSNPDVWNYKNSVRTIHDMWYYVDRKWRWFDSNGAWHDYMDIDKFDWIQDKESNKPAKFGNNRRHFAHGCDIYTMNNATQTGSELHRYRFNEDGWWDGTDEVSAWKWHLNTDNNKWWFGKDEVSSNKDYAHDQWLYVYDTSQANPTKSLYYFDSEGYVVSDLTETVNWEWKTNDGSNWWFGSDNKEQRAVYLTNQWAKIDGDWCYFDSNGEQVDEGILYTELYRNFATTIIDNCVSAIDINVQLMYDALYAHMRDYCTKLYEKDGYDKPSITVTANVVDLSKTTEYKDSPDLMTIHLGDKVKVIDYVHYPDFEYHLRVVGLQYDCIRGYNTQVTIGDLSKKVSQMISANLGGKGEQKLVAGENVTIDGNVINAVTNVGDIYAGSQVDVEQVVTSGTELAKVYVDGVPTSIYGSKDVKVTRNLTEGTQIADIKVGNQHNYLFAPNGLRYWTETETEIYNNGLTEGFVADSQYLFTEFDYHNYNSENDNYYFKKYTDEKAIACRNADTKSFIIVSCESLDAVRFLYKQYRGQEGWTAYQNPINDTSHGIYSACMKTTSFTYNETTWYASWGYDDNTTENPFPAIATLDFILPQRGDFFSITDLVNASKHLIDKAHASKYRPDKEGISNQDHIVFYNSYPDDPNHEDDVYISKSGVFHGTLYEDAEGNPISGGGLSKTELYSASSYSATVNLSSAYTGYQFLLIQTYNSDDKESLSTMLNVADLASGQRIGINDYLLYTITNSSKLTFYSSFDDTNHTRYIKGIYGLKTFNGSDVPNIITDVKVNNSSVVSGGVAQIDLTGYAQTSDLPTDFAGSTHGLVPSVQTQANKFLRDDGTWATASGASSIDTLTDVNLTSLANGQILKYNSTTQKWENANEVSYSDFAGSTHGLVPEVQTQAGKFLKDDGSWDTPASGSTSLDGLTDVDLTSPTDGQILKYDATSQEWINANESGGTTVVANPSGTATADLEKLQVGNDIYSIPSGGSGVDLSLYANWEHKNKITTVSHSINNGDTYHSGLSVQKSTLNLNNKEVVFQSALFRGYDANDNPYILDGQVTSFEEVSNAFLMNYDVTNTSGTTISYFEIDYWVISPKAGSGGGGASDLDDLTDVDITSPSNGQVLTYNSTSQKWENSNASGGASDLEDLGDVNISTVTDGQTLQYDATSQKWVNTTPSGGGGTNTLLYQGTGTSNPSQIVLSDAYTNYDLLIIRTRRNADSRWYKSDKTFSVLGLETNDYIQDIGWAPNNNYWTYQIANSTTLNRIAQGANYYLYEIYGVKL